jgi:hypothetical protein
MKKSNIVYLAVLAVAGAGYLSSTLNNQATLPTPTTLPTPIENSSRQGCDPNYTGCVPIASDVDCEGRGGNGPAYVKGPITVIGTDIYDLDRDGDGKACE